MTNRNPSAVARVFFQEIEEGDRRKLEAASNDSPTGGGARDLRLPHKAFWPLLRKFFPEERLARRRRGGGPLDLTVHVGEFFWVETSKDGEEAVRSQSVVYEPPTDARPTEGRITNIHELPALRDTVPPPTQGRVFLLLVQRVNGRVFPHYITEATLQDPQFNREVALHIADCIEQAEHRNRKARGYLDFISGETYCHA